MANIEIKTPVPIYVIWLIIAIIGTAMLFTGIQLAVNGTSTIVMQVMLIVIGIILLFLGLVMTLGYANIEAKAENASKKAKK